jgi:hypothetical protein
MSSVTPEEVLRSVAECINTGNLDSLMMLYDPDAFLPINLGNSLRVEKVYVKV